MQKAENRPSTIGAGKLRDQKTNTYIDRARGRTENMPIGRAMVLEIRPATKSKHSTLRI